MSNSYRQAVVLAAWFSCFGCQGRGGEDPRTATAQKALAPTPARLDFVILAQRTIELKEDVIVLGADVGTIDTGPGPTRARIGPKAQIDQKQRLIAETVELRSRAEVGAIETNRLNLQGRPTYGAVSPFPSQMPSLPAIVEATPGSQDLTVPDHLTQELPGPGAYRAVVVGVGSVLRLPAGRYDLASLSLLEHSRLEALGPVDLRIAGQLRAGEGSKLGPAPGLVARDLRITVLGPDRAGEEDDSDSELEHDSGDGDPSVEVGPKSELRGVLLGLKGTVRLKEGALLTGAIAAQSVTLDPHVRVTFESGLEEPRACPLTCDDQNPCTFDACADFACTHVPLVDGAPCDDRDGCTVEDACILGACAGAPRTCVAADACHVAGSCDPNTGACTSPAAPDGTACDDANACTASDACTQGACSGALAACAPPGACHEAGTCDPTTGACTYPATADGVPCDDGDDSTIGDTCQGGLCFGSIDLSPVFTSAPAQRAVAGQLYQSRVHAVAYNAADPIQYGIDSGPAGLLINGDTGDLRWVPLESQVGTATLIVRATDPSGSTSSLATILTVEPTNRPPTITSTPPLTATQGVGYVYQATATDPDSFEILTFRLDSGPAGMSVTAAGEVSWTPSEIQRGPFSVVLSIADSAGHSALQSFTIDVAAVPHAPTFVSTPPPAATEGMPWIYALSTRDPDALETVTYALAVAPNGMALSGNVVTWTPSGAQGGTQAIELTATDAAGLTTSQAFTVTVTPVNDPPSFASTPPVFATQHAAYTYEPISLDPDGDPLTFALDAAPLGMAIDPALGTVTWTPNAAQLGAYDVILRATDGSGAIAVQSFTLSVADANDPPVFVTTAVTSAIENQLYTYAARAVDPDPGDTRSYALVESPAGLRLSLGGDLSWVPAAADAGTHPIRIRVTDSAGSFAEQAFTLTVLAAGGTPCAPGDLTARCSALGFAFAIGSDSVPLEGIRVEELDPAGVLHTKLSAPETGGVVLGTGLPGLYEWRLSSPGYVPVFRRGELSSGRVRFVEMPRLHPLTDLAFTLTATGAVRSDSANRVTLAFPPGSTIAPVAVHAATLDGQSLPAFLPLGYSPAAAVHYETDAPIVLAPIASFKLPARLPGPATLVLGRFDPVSGVWVHARDVFAGTSTEAHPVVEVALDGPGGYALLVPDQGPTAPPVVAIDGELLASSSVPLDPLAVSAGGAAVPAVHVQSLVPSQVTAEAQVWLASQAALPSGVVLPARVLEVYQPPEAPAMEVPVIDLSVALYRYPPLVTAPPGALASEAPLRPRYLLEGPDVIQRIDVVAEESFSGAPIDATGGAIARGTITVTVPAGAFSTPALVELTPLPTAGFSLDGQSAIRAFTLGWSGDALSALSPLLVDFGPVVPNSELVLARRLLDPEGYLPIERFRSDAAGTLVSLEPASTPRLPGITASGTYALFVVPVREGIVHGTTLDPMGEALAQILVEVEGRPWRDSTDASGAFMLLGRPGSISVLAARPGTTDTGIFSGALLDAAGALFAPIVVEATAPQVIAVSPSDGTTAVPVLAAVEVDFSEPIAPTLGASALTLRDPSGHLVDASLRLSSNRRRLTLLPANPLAFDTAYTAVVSTAITDDAGRHLPSTRSFTFTTVGARTAPSGSARLTSYAPGSQNTPCAPYDPATVPPDFDPTGQAFGVPGFDPENRMITCVVGSAGLSDPTRPVILTNDDSGAAATVTAQTNGSFKGFILAREDELLSAILLNANGTRLTVPLSQQRFDDGRVALYAGGGAIDASNPLGGEPIQVLVHPGTISRRLIFHLTPRTAEELLAENGGVAPEEGQLLFGGHLSIEGGEPGRPLEVRLPASIDDLNLPAGTSTNTAGFLLVEPVTVTSLGEAVAAYHTIDRLYYDAGALATRGEYPFAGMGFFIAGGLLAQASFGVAVISRLPTPIAGHVVACQQGDSSPPDICKQAGGTFTLSATPEPGAENIMLSSLSGSGSVLATGARILPGAVVHATASGLSETSQLQAGGYVSIADRQGRYALAAPLYFTQVTLVAATHPDFIKPAVRSIHVEPAAQGITHGLNLVFSDPIPFGSLDRGPTLTVTHTPDFPAPWSPSGSPAPEPGQIAQIRLSARGIDAMPTGLQLVVSEVTSLTQGETITRGEVAITASTTIERPELFEQTQLYFVVSPKAARVRFDAQASTLGTTHQAHLVMFGAAPPTETDPLQPPDPGDKTGPRVLRSSPVDRAVSVPTNAPLVFRMSEPIHRSVLECEECFVLSPDDDGDLALTLDADGMTLRVAFATLKPETDYTLLFGGGIFDLHGNGYDDDPATPAREPKVFRFRTAPKALEHAAELGTIEVGGGAVVHGAYTFVLDRVENAVRIFDISDPTQPVLATSHFFFGGMPRSLALIADTGYVLPFSDEEGELPCAAVRPWEVFVPEAPGLQYCWSPNPPFEDEQTELCNPSIVTSGCESSHRTLLVVTGGSYGAPTDDPDIGGSIGVVEPGPYLAVLDVTDPPLPAEIAYAHFAPDPTATASLLKWSAPYLGILERNLTRAQVDLVSLQSFLFGVHLTKKQLSTMPLGGYSGFDADGDGSFLGANDFLPMPARYLVGSIPGRERVVYPYDTTQDIRDYNLDGKAMFVGAALGTGRLVDELGNTSSTATVGLAYRTLLSGPLMGTNLPRSRAALPFFPPVQDLDAVYALMGQRITIRGAPSVRDLVLVAATTTTVSAAFQTRLFLVDVTDPLAPALLDTKGIPLPNDPTLEGAVRTIRPDPSDPTRLLLFTGKNVYRVDTSRLGEPMEEGQTHPAILGRESGLGSRTAAGVTDFGVAVLADNRSLAITKESPKRTTNVVAFTGPELELVSFSSERSIVDPTRSRDDEELRQLFTTMDPTAHLRVARVKPKLPVYPSTLTPPSPLVHHHVLVRAPGKAGDTLNLLLETTNDAGAPIPDLGPGFAPSRAAPEDLVLPRKGAAAVRPLVAHRLSAKLASPYYNVYLSDPFAMVYESLSADEVAELRKVDGITREVYHSSYGVRISLAPDLPARHFLAPFASRVDWGTQRLILGTTVEATSLDVHRIVGPNPAPVFTSAVKAPGTLAMVSAHNREMALSSVDVSLPSPRMPLVFERTYLGQDHFEGPLGPGWDFFYNQRITEVSTQHLPFGAKMLLVFRDGASLDTAAKAGDVLLHSGDGRVVLYKRAPGTTTPTEYAQDALLTSKTSWEGQTIWYLPPPGVFDALVRFGEHGPYLRLTPDGTEYRYDPSGYLARLHDRYESNVHEVFRGRTGEVRRVVDRSIGGKERSFDIGYYRGTSDSSPASQNDVAASDSAKVSWNKIAKVVDSANRVVNYSYDVDGQLEKVAGVEIKNNPGGFTGSRTRTYAWGEDHTLTAVLGADPNAAPLFAGVTSGEGVIVNGNGAHGHVVLDANHGNTAEEFLGGQARVTVTTEDAVGTTFIFNPYAAQKGEIVSREATEATDLTYVEGGPDAHALVRSVRRPRGNDRRFTYEDPSPNLRSRGNVTMVDDFPVPGASGEILSRATSYDPTYNQPIGGQDPAGRAIGITLADGNRSVGRIDFRSDLSATFGHNSLGQLASSTSLAGVSSSWDFNSPGGFLSSATTGEPVSGGPASLTTFYDYAGCTAGSDLGRPCRVAPPSGAPMSFDYAEDGTAISYERGSHATRTPFDRNNRVVREETAFSDGTARVSRSTPNQVGFEDSSVVEGLETMGTTPNVTWSATPDALNRVYSTTTPDGRTTTFTRDLRGRIVAAQTGDHREEISYDLNGNPTELRVGGALVERRTYNGHDQLETVTDAYGTITTYSYNFAGELQSVRTDDPDYGPLSDMSGIQLDVLGRPERLSNGGAPYRLDYPRGGNRSLEVTGPLGKTSRASLDPAGRLAQASVATASGQPLSSVVMQYSEGTNRSIQSVVQEGLTTQDFGETTTFDVQGNLQSIQSSDGERVDFQTRSDGALLARTVFPEPAAPGLTTSFPASRLGESLGEIRPSGVTTTMQLDSARRLGAEGRPTALRRYGYDASDRLNQVQEPDGQVWSLESFDGRDQPQHITMPGGGQIDASYDVLGRKLRHDVRFGSFVATERFRYDGFGRIRHADSATAAVDSTYDVRGNLTDLRVQANGLSLPMAFPVALDDSPAGLTYPSGFVTTDVRDDFGQLRQKVEVATNRVIATATAGYTMINAPSRLVLGNGVARTDTYDAKRRLLSRRYARGDATLTEQRYAYDGAGRQIALQSLHKGGRVDLFGYDRDNRLATAEVDARPATSQDASAAPWAVATAQPGTWRPGRYQRRYDFDTAATDAMISAATRVAPGLTAPPFAEVQDNIDAFGLAMRLEVNGSPVARARDALGNITQTLLPSGPGTLRFDGFSRLREITRADGARLEYAYRPDGILVSRNLTCNGAPNCQNSRRTYAYAGLLLLEEYEGARLDARYIYADASDIPIAADLYDVDTATLQRVYYATDRMGSIIAVFDDAGATIERISYDPYGSPTIEPADTTAPVVSTIRQEANGDLLVAFSEAVLPPPVAQATGIVTALAPLANAFEVNLRSGPTTTPVGGTWSYDETHPDFGHGTTLRFTPNAPLAAGATIEIAVQRGGLLDTWSNATAGNTLSVVLGAGVLYTGPPQGSTATQPIAKSLVHNGLLFEAHLWDADAGLYLARARVLDPATGTYLSRDPELFSDSVNLYSFVRSNPVNNRDPTGRFIPLIAACALNPVCAGAVIGAGVAAYAQVADLFTSGHLRTNAEIATGLGVGAAAGVVGVGAGALAATGATSLGLASGSVATGLLGSAAGGAAGGSTARLLSGEDLTVETVATDAVVGMATYGVLRGGTALANAGRSIGTSPYPAAYDDVVESLRSGGGPLPPEGIGATAVVGPRVSQKQLRHVLDRPEWLARGRGSYFRSVADAQRVLDAYHSGNAKVLGRTKAGHVVVKYDDVTGYNTNRSAGFEDQPTNVFMLKGTAAPSVVPTSPRWSPSNSVEP